MQNRSSVYLWVSRKICARTSQSDGIPWLDSSHGPNGVETRSVDKISAESRAMMREMQVSGRALPQLVGKMNANPTSPATT